MAALFIVGAPARFWGRAEYTGEEEDSMREKGESGLGPSSVVHAKREEGGRACVARSRRWQQGLQRTAGLPLLLSRRKTTGSWVGRARWAGALGVR